MLFDVFFRKNNVIKIYERLLNHKCLSAKQINQGFYGWVFLIETDDNTKVIAKVYKQPGYIDTEICQLDMMRKHALVKVPEIYCADYKKDNGCFDILFMEYINGVNAGAVNITDEKEKMIFSNQVVENLLAIHEVSNSNGFGSYINDDYCISWESCYKAQITEFYNRIHSKKTILFSKTSFDLMEFLYDSFDSIFCEPVSESHLIHGDYNLWNLIADPESKQLIGMIDPFGSCFADRELDLFQLTNANGDYYGLLDNYKSHIHLSDNFEIKNAYYFFWDDVKHMLNMGYCDNKRFRKNGTIVKNNL